jgi:cob(I)alamin adenosyltransferase
VRIYTRRGDDGTTGLLYGGRVGKASPRIELNGAVDEAQAALGLARAESSPGSELDELLVVLERELYVLMAEVATAPENRGKLVAGESLVTEPMVLRLEGWIDRLSERFEMPTEFVVPGATRVAAALDVARTVVRRAERVLASMRPLHEAASTPAGEAAGGGEPSHVGPTRGTPGGGEPSHVGPTRGTPGGGEPSHVGPYLNRLSDLLWTMARWQEGDVHLAARERPRHRGEA